MLDQSSVKSVSLCVKIFYAYCCRCLNVHVFVDMQTLTRRRTSYLAGVKTQFQLKKTQIFGYRSTTSRMCRTSSVTRTSTAQVNSHSVARDSCGTVSVTRIEFFSTCARLSLADCLRLSGLMVRMPDARPAVAGSTPSCHDTARLFLR